MVFRDLGFEITKSNPSGEQTFSGLQEGDEEFVRESPGDWGIYVPHTVGDAWLKAKDMLDAANLPAAERGEARKRILRELLASSLSQA